MYSTARFTGQRGGRSEKSKKKWQRHRPDQQVAAGAELCLRALRPLQEGCREELRKGSGASRPKRSPGGAMAGCGVQGAPGPTTRRVSARHTHPGPRRPAGRGRRASSSRVCGVEQRAQTHRLLRCLSASRAPFISRRGGQAQSLTSCVCAARLLNHPSSLPFHSSPPPITSFPELCDRPVDGIQHTKMLIGRKLKKKQSLVNVHSLCARSGTAEGRGGGGCAPESLHGTAGRTPVLRAHSTDGRGKRTPTPIQTGTGE